MKKKLIKVNTTNDKIKKSYKIEFNKIKIKYKKSINKYKKTFRKYKKIKKKFIRLTNLLD